MPHRPAIERFWRKIEIQPIRGCWAWLGSLNTGGYGQFADGGLIRAHRWSYIHFRGPIPEGLQVDHLCRWRSCVNPEHLELVTCKENLRRGIWLRKRGPKAKGPSGHPD